MQIKLTDIKGTGKDGRILKEDILKYIDKKSQPISSNIEDEITIEPVRGYTRAMIKTMTEAVVNILLKITQINLPIKNNIFSKFLNLFITTK